MSASKFTHFGGVLFRAATHKPLSATPPFLLLKPFIPPKPLQFRRYTSSSTTFNAFVTSDDDTPPQSPPLHPWPEWVTFVDQLKTKGYFTEASGQVAEGDAADSFYKDINLLKNPCLSFGRDRYDVFKSLSMPDIQTVVGVGCPNLLRKTVNSAKRLRAYVQLVEGDVCSACNLRPSCDRSYVLLKGSEADARTADIVRILLFYALDPLVISQGDRHPGRELVEAAARKLLSQLIELSETARDPSLSKPPTIAKKATSRELDVTFSDDEVSKNVEMRRGDWTCPKCDFLNFAKNTRCLKCRERGPIRTGANDIEMKQGDWLCAECNYMNFARNSRCLRCRVEAPKGAGVTNIEMKKGDWICPECEFMNFANKRKCMRCQEPQPKRKLNPGEWECPHCNVLNYRGRIRCFKCNGECPKEETQEYDEQMWRSEY